MTSDEAVVAPIPATATTLLQAFLRRPTTMPARQIAAKRNAAEYTTCTVSTAPETAQTIRRGVGDSITRQINPMLKTKRSMPRP